MTRKPGERKTNRRDFLGGLAAAGGVAVVAATSSSASAETAPGERPETSERKGYRVTAHVAKYYDKARI